MRLEGDRFVNSTLEEGYDFFIKDRWKKEFHFRVSTFPCPTGLISEAIEVKPDDAEGYMFSILSHIDTDIEKAELLLKAKIKKGINTRYLTTRSGRLNIGDKNQLRGRIGYNTDLTDTEHENVLIIDGKRITFEQLVIMLRGFEGWQFDLKLIDPCD